MARKYKATKPISLFSGGSASKEGCGGPDDPIIFPGGGDCGGGGGACTGPDCPDPPTGDDPCLLPNPPAYCDDYPCAVHCDDDKCGVEKQDCIGPDCVDPADHPELDYLDLSFFNGFCIGLDCEYIGGKFHVYREASWRCSRPDLCDPLDATDCNAKFGVDTNGYGMVGVTLNYYTMTAPASFISAGINKIEDYKHYIGSEEHYRLSSQEMGRQIQGGDGFYPARHGAHMWAYKGDSDASSFSHPWNFSGEAVGTWKVHSLYGGILNSITDFNGKPNPKNTPLREAMLRKSSVDKVYIYMGKMHCDAPRYVRQFPFAVSSPGVLEVNTDFLLTTGGKLTHTQSVVRPRNWRWHFPVAYDLTDTCDSGNMCYDEFMGEDINGNPVKSIFLMPGNSIGPAYETIIGTNECLVEEEDIVDCADPNAFNFNPDPDIVHDADTCCYISSCTNPNAFNYNEDACHDDGSCCYEDGCIDPAATNYDPLVCFDDGSCCYISGCTDPAASNYNALACIDDGSCILPSAEGYTYGLWCEHFTLDSGYTETNNYAYQLKPGMLSPGASSAFGTGPWGCTDQAPEMDVPQQGVEIKTSAGLNKLLQPGDTVGPDNQNDEACVTYVGTIESTTDLVTSNQVDIGSGQTIQLHPGAGVNGPCPGTMPVVSSYTIVGGEFSRGCSTCCDKITDPNCDDGPGCDEPLADNYNPSATNIDNDTCEWLVPRYCTNPPGDNTIENVYLYGDSSLAAQPDITTGTLADNIVFFQNYLDYELPGSPSIPVVMFNIPEGTASSAGPICLFWLGWDTYVGDGSILFNSTDGFAGGPTPGLLGPYGNGAYTNILNGGQIVLKNSAFTCGTCGPPGSAVPSGCTDQMALNYDPFAVTDDGSCDYPQGDINGCMDVSSEDHNPAATVEDGSCTWEICCCGSENLDCACDPLAINSGYLLGQFDAAGMAVGLSQGIIDYEAIYAGAIIPIGTGASGTYGSCIHCDPNGENDDGPYVNTDGVQKIALAKVMYAFQHGDPQVVNHFGGDQSNITALEDSDVILDLQYPLPSSLVINPNTSEIDATNGIPGNPAYPAYGFDPAVTIVPSTGGSSHSAILSPTLGNVIEYQETVSGVTYNVGKAIRIPNWVAGVSNAARLTITRKGTGCENLFLANDFTSQQA